MPFVEDLAQFLKPPEFASSATLGGVAVRVIFDKPYYDAASGLSSTNPTVTIATSDCAAIVINTTQLVIPSNGTYRVINHEPDGTGVSTLQLVKVA